MFPMNVTVSWDASPPDEGVTHYVVTLDGVEVGQPTTESLVVPIPHSGTYAFGVSAVNEWGSSDPTIDTKKITPASSITGLKIKKAP